MKSVQQPVNWPKYMEIVEDIDMFCEHGKLKVMYTSKYQDGNRIANRIFKITTNLEYLPHDNRI